MIEDGAAHALNNLLGKIVGAAELALDSVESPLAREEIEQVIRLAEEGAEMIGRLRQPANRD